MVAIPGFYDKPRQCARRFEVEDLGRDCQRKCGPNGGRGSPAASLALRSVQPFSTGATLYSNEVNGFECLSNGVPKRPPRTSASTVYRSRKLPACFSTPCRRPATIRTFGR